MYAFIFSNIHECFTLEIPITEISQVMAIRNLLSNFSYTSKRNST